MNRLFNLYEGKKKIDGSLIASVAKEIPFKGAIRFTMSDGSHLMAWRRDYRKNEIYDIYFENEVQD